MRKIAIFNVGGAFSSYIEIDDRKVVIDLGKSEEFNPILDFFLPLAKERFTKSEEDQERYHIEQAFLSHLDNDHISAVDEFDEFFLPQLLTSPSDHPRQNKLFSIIRNLFDSENRKREKVLRLMSQRSPGYGREIEEDYNNPLVVHKECLENISLYYIPPSECNRLDELSDGEHNNYKNNISLVVLVEINEHTILFPGDTMPDGMEYLIENNQEFKEKLISRGIDFLIAPHHGLSTSFPTALFKTIKDNKVRLNIISEKKLKKDKKENRRDVHSNYYSPDYSKGISVVNGQDGTQYGIITSRGHIVIDFDSQDPIVKRCSNQELLKEFL